MTSNPVFNGSFLGRSSSVCDFISPVAQPKDCVGGNHQDVEQIEKENRVKMVKQFVGDARQISQNEYQKEEQTFSLGGISRSARWKRAMPPQSTAASALPDRSTAVHPFDSGLLQNMSFHLAEHLMEPEAVLQVQHRVQCIDMQLIGVRLIGGRHAAIAG